MVIRLATLDDIPFLVRVDLEDEGVDPGYRDDWGDAELAEHRKLVKSFVTSPDKGARILESEDRHSIGCIMWRYENRLSDILPDGSVFRHIDASIFPADGAFCEIFQLWVAPKYRRQGHGTKLKITAEDDARLRGVGMIYTHTEETNPHVIALNEKLGYVEVRRGPIWDAIVRVSLVKHLNAPFSDA